MAIRLQNAPVRSIRAIALIAGIAAAMVPLVASAQPIATSTFNNFVSAGTLWNSGTTNWLPNSVPVSSATNSLWFGSSPLQTVTGYTTTNNLGAFQLNAMVFNAFSSASGGVTYTSPAATDFLDFSLNALVAPSIWQNGTGRAQIRGFANTTPSIRVNNTGAPATLELLGDGLGDLFIDNTIGQTDVSVNAPAASLRINRGGTRSFFTGSITRLGGSQVTSLAGGVTLDSGNVMLSNVLGNTGAINLTANAAATPINALGTGTLTVNGGSIQFDPLAISSGVSPTGITGTLQLANNIVLNNTLNITGNLPATAPSGGIVGIFSGNISGNRGINVATNNGNSVYAFTGNNSFTGPVVVQPVGNTTSTVQAGTAGVSTGNFAGTTSFTITGTSSLTLNNLAGAATRLNTVTAPDITLNRSDVNLFGNNTTVVSETFNNLNVVGMGTLTSRAGGTIPAIGATANLRFNTLNRGSTGTLTVQGTNLGRGTGTNEGRVFITNNPGGAIGGGGIAATTNRDILPYAVGNSQEIWVGPNQTASAGGTPLNANIVSTFSQSWGLLRWDTVAGELVPLNPTTEYANNSALYVGAATGSLNPGTNVRTASTGAAPGTFGIAGINNNTTVNALVLDQNVGTTTPVAISAQGSGVVTVASGTVLVGVNGATTGTPVVPTIPSLINFAGLNFGSNTGYIHTVATGNLIVNSPITGSSGLVKSQFGTLILNGNNSFTGGLTVAAGPVQFTSDANLGAAGQPLNLNSGLGNSLVLQPSNTFTTANVGTVSINRPITIGASGTAATVTLANNNLVLAGSLSGNAPLLKAGAGILTLSGTNTNTGPTTVFAGILAADSDAALGGTGSNLVLTNSGTFQPNNSFSTSRDVMLTGSGFIFTNGKDLTVNGNLTSTFTSGTFFKTGTGDLVLTSQNAFTGSVQLGESTPVVRATATQGAQTPGRLILNGTNGSIAQAFNVFSIGGGELILDNSVSANNNRIGNVALLLIGGNATLIGNASTPINEQVGAINISNANNQYGGRLTIVSPTGAGATTLTSTGAYVPPVGPSTGSLFVRATNLGAISGDRGVLVLPTSPAAINGIIPSIFVASSDTATDATDFATVATITNAAPNLNQFSLVPLPAIGYTPGTGALAAGSATLTYDISGVTSFTSGSAANAMRIQGGSAITLAGAHTITSGAILTTGSGATTITGGNLNYAAGVSARFAVGGTADLTVPAITSTTGGINKLGTGVLTLGGAVTTTTGLIGVSSGTLRYGVANALPTTAQPFINAGALLDLNNTTSTLGGLIGWGDTNIGSGSLTLNVATTPILAYAGGLRGTGALIKTGLGNQILAGDSPLFSGDVRVLGGANAVSGTNQSGLVVQSAGALGTGTSPILLGDTSGSVQAAIALGASLTSFSRDITVQSGSTPTTPHALAVGTSTINITSNLILNQNLRLTNFGNNLGNATLNGTISGPGGLVMFFGSWTFNGNNTYGGGTTFDSGSSAGFGIGSNTALGTGPVTFTSAGGYLRADSAPRTLANNITLQTGAVFGVAGTQPLTLSGTMDLSGGVQNINIINTTPTTFSGVISNGGITKNGPGVLNLNAANLYTGLTTVNAGTLLVNGTVAGPAAVNSGAILGGSGTVNGNIAVNSGGILSPGNSPGVLTSTGNLGFADSASVYAVEITGNVAGSGYDQTLLTGGTSTTISLGSATLLFPTATGSFAPGDYLTIIRNELGTAATGTFAGLAEGASVPALAGLGGIPAWNIHYGADVDLTGALLSTTLGNDVVLVAVPEPTVLGLLAAASVMVLRRKRR